MNRSTVFCISAALLAVPLVALLVATPASAHICTAVDPKTSCGECRSLGYHDHRYTNGNTYCNSIGALLEDITSNGLA